MVLPGQDPRGQPILSVLLKRSYRIRSRQPAERLEGARPLVTGDRHFGDPMNSTVEFESDLVPFKIATDVVVNATAYAPAGSLTQQMTASVVVGAYRKDLVVTGDRVAKFRAGRDPIFTDPIPFRSLPVRYERAYGGVDVRSDPSMACAYARNHLGLGFAIRNVAEAVDDLALPNLERPDDWLQPERLCVGHVMHWERQPKPDGFGWTSKYWHPRAGRAGVMPGDRSLEQRLRRLYTRVMPLELRADYAKTALPDMNFAFFNGASPELTRPYLKGDEVLAFRNLHPTGDVVGRLPADHPRIALDLGAGGQGEQSCVLQTVMVRLEELEFDLTWRAAFPYAGLDSVPQLRRLDVQVMDE